MAINFHSFVAFLILFALPYVFYSVPITPEIVQSMNRISSATSSLKGDYVIYANTHWNKETGKKTTHLMFTEISTGKHSDLTKEVEGQADSNPIFSTLYPNLIFFSRANANTHNSIYYMTFPPVEGEEPELLATYPVEVNDFKIKQDTLVFSANVYFKCADLKCSADLISAEEAATYQTYDRLFMFHWDQWLPQGKGSHIFYQKIKQDETTKKLSVLGDPVDITKDMEVNAPPLDTDSSNYDISRDGNMIAFSAHVRDEKESWSTGWQTYFMDMEIMTKPVLITGHTNARTEQPQFSKDGTKIAYIAKKTPGLEAEFGHFEIYNILSNRVDILNDYDFDKGADAFIWASDTEIYFETSDTGLNKIFRVDFHNIAKPEYSLFPVTTGTYSYSVPFEPLSNHNVLFAVKMGFDLPDSIVMLPSYKGSSEEKEIVNLNKETLATLDIAQYEQFHFTGGYNDQVYGWIMKPINFDETKQYPVALLIHGGPESSWLSSWSYRWNPQLWASQGYVAVMIDPHGSTGYTSEFLNSVRNDFGGVPYEDLINGMKYVTDTYPFADGTKACALGGSYGGYMVNWINGHTNQFKCLVVHDGDFNSLSTNYDTDELWYQKSDYCPRDKIGCNPFDSPEIRKGFEKFSAEKFVQNWSTPTLVIHGGKDYRVQLTEGLSTFTALQLKGIKSRLLYFPMENHWVLKAENSIKWYEEVFRWMTENLA